MATTNPQSKERPAAEEKQFEERVLNIDRVARVVKGGRRFRFRALVVVGDRKGKVGVGIAKGADVTSAISKATDVAKKSMITVALAKNTIPHETETKLSGARIRLMPASPGTGLIAGGAVRTILEVAGVKNALSKSLGSSNKANIAYATIKGLESIQSEDQWLTTKVAGSSKLKAESKTTGSSKPKAEGKTAQSPKPKAEKKTTAKKSEKKTEKKNA
ncbi:MAG: 30S ribosomal protein S5 [Candidatus Saccharibacteria bacterium]|nr:30S ribosomal protein S5 [Candidatus Saccharibacteria bacterium]MDZ7785660.1 30S ribosomal protein S5 [Candidatus Saccharibacteria bacterium]